MASTITIQGKFVSGAVGVPVVDSSNVAGGLHSFDTFDDISTFANKAVNRNFWVDGMLGYVKAEGKYYKFDASYGADGVTIKACKLQEFKTGADDAVIETINNRLSALDSSDAETVQEIDVIKTKLQNLDSSDAETAKTIESVSAKLQTLDSSSAAAVKALDNLNDSISALDSSNAEMAYQISALDSSNAEMAYQISTLNSSNGEMANTLKAIDEKVNDFDSSTTAAIEQLTAKIQELWDIHYYTKPISLSESNVQITYTANPAPFYKGRNTILTYNCKVSGYPYEISSVKINQVEILQSALSANGEVEKKNIQPTTNYCTQTYTPNYVISVATDYKDERGNAPEISQIEVQFPAAEAIVVNYVWNQKTAIFQDSYKHGDNYGDVPADWADAVAWSGNTVEFSNTSDVAQYICFISPVKYSSFYVYAAASGKQTAGGVTYVKEIEFTQYDQVVKYYLYRTSQKLGADNWVIECA